MATAAAAATATAAAAAFSAAHKQIFAATCSRQRATGNVATISTLVKLEFQFWLGLGSLSDSVYGRVDSLNRCALVYFDVLQPLL